MSPAGPVHHKYHQAYMPVAFAVSIAVFIAGFFVDGGYISEGAVWFLFWYWAGRYIDPDWDLQGITMAEGRMTRELDILGVFMAPVTAFYAAAVGYTIRKFNVKGAIGGTHRTYLTHSLIPGTLGRQLLICSILYFVLNLANDAVAHIIGGRLEFATLDLFAFVVGQFLGLGSADLVHIILDNYYHEKKGVDE